MSLFQVHAHQSESPTLASEDYPIQIQKVRSAAAPQNPTSAASSNLQHQLGTGTTGSSGTMARRTGVEAIDRTPQRFPQQRRLEGLGHCDPPRYSTLSLPALDYGLRERSSSIETREYPVSNISTTYHVTLIRANSRFFNFCISSTTQLRRCPLAMN